MPDFGLDAEISAFIDTSLRVSGNLSTETSIQQQRAWAELYYRYFHAGHPPGIKTRDETVSGRHGPINIRHYRHTPSPLLKYTQLVFMHGGGEQVELESYRSNANAPLLSTADIHYYNKMRCAGGLLPFDDPEFYPLRETDFGSLPPTIVFSADTDPLRDDASLYVDKLRQAGVEARLLNEPGLVYDYLRARHSSARARASFTRICTALSQLTATAVNQSW